MATVKYLCHTWLAPYLFCRFLRGSQEGQIGNRQMGNIRHGINLKKNGMLAHPDCCLQSRRGRRSFDEAGSVSAASNFASMKALNSGIPLMSPR